MSRTLDHTGLVLVVGRSDWRRRRALAVAFGPVRLLIVSQGDGTDRATWSGIPCNLGLALEAHGATVDHIDANPPKALLRTAVGILRAGGIKHPNAGHGPELAALRSWRIARILRRAPKALVLQLDTGFSLPSGRPFVTLHDMTVSQARRVGWSDPAEMTPRAATAWERRDRTVCRRAARCCVASDWAADSVVGDYAVPRSKVHTVGFGINAPTRARERDWRRPRFLFVGREWERKNGALVLSAFRRLRARFPDATLTVVGEPPPLAEPRVIDAGRLSFAVPVQRDALVRHFEESTCFVLPSRMEPFGIAYLEAASAGVPSIGTTVGGAATAIGPGGVLVDPDDEEGLLAAMVRLADPETAHRLGGLAAAHAKAFTWEAVAERVLEVCERAGSIAR